MVLPVTLSCAAGLALLALWLAFRVGQVRRASRVLVGDGGHDPLVRRMRAQGNFVETAPFALALIGLLEAAGEPRAWLWAATAVLLAARVVHAFGMDGWRLGRSAGFAATMAVIVALAVDALEVAWRVERVAAIVP